MIKEIIMQIININNVIMLPTVKAQILNSYQAHGTMTNYHNKDSNYCSFQQQLPEKEEEIIKSCAACKEKSGNKTYARNRNCIFMVMHIVQQAFYKNGKYKTKIEN